jgi:hypothetical protein
MIEIFTQAPLELRILIGGCLISGAWFMVSEYRAEQKRKKRHQRDLNESFKKARLTIVKK